MILALAWTAWLAIGCAVVLPGMEDGVASVRAEFPDAGFFGLWFVAMLMVVTWPLALWIDRK